MNKQKIVKSSGIKRIVYKEIVEGDRRKFVAESNDSPTGGGARDLRFSPYSEFRPVFERMLPNIIENDVCTGKFFWKQGDIKQSKDIFFHPPTTSRANEGRIANINTWPSSSLPPEDDGTMFLLIVQGDDDFVWVYFTTDKSLREEEWDPRVSKVILNCFSQRRTNISTVGFIDFENGSNYCNGK